MVTTFLTHSPLEIDPKTGKNGYRISAKNLDFKRLNKQILEGTQILELVKNFHVLGEIFKDPVPKNPYECYAWIRKIKKKYDSLNYYLFLHQGGYAWIKKDKPKPIKIRYDEKYEITENGNIIYKGEKYLKYSLVLPGDRFYSLGFWAHPVVIMWLNHPESLKLYINEHLDEFIARGGKASSINRKYSLKSEKIEHPVWTLDEKIHINHKAALLTKEIVRKEAEWYINFKDFVFAYNFYTNSPPKNKTKSTSDFEYYIWPFTQDLKTPIYNL